MSNFLIALALVVTAVQASDVEIIARDGMSHVDEARTAVAFTEGEWSTLWRAHAGDKALPKVDFTKRRVIAIFLGSRPTAGYEIEIVGVKADGGNVTVEWTEVRPKPGVLLAQVMTSPAVIASIPTTAANIGFRKVTR